MTDEQLYYKVIWPEDKKRFLELLETVKRRGDVLNVLNSEEWRTAVIDILEIIARRVGLLKFEVGK